MLTTDASLTGWGAVMSGRSAQGLWEGHHLMWHINCLEMLAVFRALKHFLPDLRGHRVLVRTDNTSVVSYINRQGGYSHSAVINLACSIQFSKLSSPVVVGTVPEKASTSWTEFWDCASNHWSEMIMTLQMRFCLVGTAGSVIHKNPRSGSWNYVHIVDVEAAYGPSSEHTAAIGIELRQSVHRAGELRDNIYKKVSIVYANPSERLQHSISIEVFTNTMGDADIVQRLLEERPCTLDRAFEITHSSQGTGHMRQNCPLPRLNLESVTLALLWPTETQPTSTVLRVKDSGPEMCIHLLLYDMEVLPCWTAGSGGMVLSRLSYKTIKTH
ncbi:hypothetical protein QQF64_034235 [Cirrhinus molitorella]|uniref:Reverse transcriptase RNase H-like domain-containing protein n=1 Tax=Cirrhinus molitorella TaxID=172907 RepID=A0ABR3MW72_9TELE